MSHTAKQAVAQRGMLAGIETKWKGALVLLVNGTWKRELFSMTVEKRLKTGSWRVVRSLIQLLMVMENRPVETKRYRTPLWLVHNLISNVVPKKMGVPFVWRLKLAHYVPKIRKSNKKRCLATI